jgi:hypothetical protein
LNRVLRRIFRPKREQVRGYKKIHNAVIICYYSQNIIYGEEIKENEMGTMCSTHYEGKKYTPKIQSENLIGRPLG